MLKSLSTNAQCTNGHGVCSTRLYFFLHHNLLLIDKYQMIGSVDNNCQQKMLKDMKKWLEIAKTKFL